MDFRQLQSFVAVVRYESFTKAASKLGLSQPTISTHVRMLEEELGIPLVLRTSKRVELTPRGRRVYDQAVSVLMMRDRLLESSKEREKNTIYLGASSIPSAYLLPDIIMEFSKEHPSTRFLIYQGDSQDIVSGIAEGMYDVGFVGMKADEDTLECVPFAHDKLVLATPANDRFRGWTPTKENAHKVLLEENVILRREGSATRSFADRMLDSLGIEEGDMRVGARVNDQETIKNLVESGYGVTLISERSVHDRVREGRILAFSIPDVPCERFLYLLYRKNSAPEEIHNFVAFVRLRYANEAWR